MALSMVVLFACTRESGENSGGSGKYVDLGLSSGTKWKDVNESIGDFNLYSYEQAMSNFGDKLPTKEQFEELLHSCNWIGMGDGCKVVGPNGNSIFLPVHGWRSCEGEVTSVGSVGFYWSSTLQDQYQSLERAWYLGIGAEGGVDIDGLEICRGLSVRLVQK